MKIATVCTGIGSPEKAIENLGIPHEIVFGCEIDKYARQTYLANFNPGFMVPDMTKENWEGERFYSDLFIGGIPCQSFSLAGKRLGELDPRGLLFFDFLRYVKNQNPKYFIIENVKGLLSDNNGETFRNWIQLLGQSENGNTFIFPHEDSLMYNLHWQVLNTKDYGLPQNRERVFLVGIRNDLPNDFNFPKTIPLKLRLKDILEPEVDEKYYLSDVAIKGFINHAERHAEKGNGFKFSPTDGEGIAVTLTTHEGSRGYNNFLKVENVGNTNPSGNGINGNVFSDEGLCPTLTTNKGEGIKVAIGAMRGRNPENPNDRSKGGNYQQTLEINENGTSNCLSTVQKDNLVIQMNPSLESGGKQPYQQNRVYDSNGITPALMAGKSDLNIIQLNNPKHSNDRIYSDEGLSPTLNTMQGGNRQPFVQNNFRIRKLTPLECFRLQGFPDEFLQNAIDAGVSNSQLYKQSGNSISVPVIQSILKNLL